MVDNVNCIRIYSKLKGKPELLVTGVKFLFQYGAIVKKFNIKTNSICNGVTCWGDFSFFKVSI